MSAVPRKFRPFGAATGVGGMPHVEAAAAVAASVSTCPELPFWPTRPGVVPDEGMVRQWSLGLPGVAEVDGMPAWVGRAEAEGLPGLVASATATLEGFLAAAVRSPAAVVKIQATGPITLALNLPAGEGPLFAVPSARGPFSVGYMARIRSVTTRVRSALPGMLLVLVLDEPGLAHPLVAANPGVAVALWRSVGTTGADVLGLHCCATPPWPLVLDLDPQLLSFDAVRDGDAATDDPAFRRLVEGGTGVAWGMVPATGPPPGASPEAVEDLGDRLLDLLEWTAGDYVSEVLARSVITPACGLAGLKPEEAERRLRLCGAVGPLARELAGLA